MQTGDAASTSLPGRETDSAEEADALSRFSRPFPSLTPDCDPPAGGIAGFPSLAPIAHAPRGRAPDFLLTPRPARDLSPPTPPLWQPPHILPALKRQATPK
jgi:hypothetical protein